MSDLVGATPPSLGLGNLPDWLARRAWSTPDRLALIDGEQRWTFAELDRQVSRTARRLATSGVRPGERIATLLPNSYHVAEIVHAVPRLGAVLVPVNIRLSPDEIAWQLQDSDARLLVCAAETAERAAAAARELPNLGVVAVDRGAGLPVFNAIPEADLVLRERMTPDSVHSIVYTSGTTGRPKGALLTYANHWWSAIGSSLNLGNQPDDRWLAVLPLFHVGGMAILLRSVIYGITTVIHRAFDPATVNRAIAEDGVTIVSVVATMLQRMLAARDGMPYPSWLRCVLLGGGPAPRPLLEQATALGVPVVQTYGLTETASQLATLAPEDALRKLGSAGKPLYPNEIRIEQFGQPAGVGEPGEILVRGPVVTAGYAGWPAETARALSGGWLHTGDLGYLDDDGYLYVLDRRTDLIVSGGENVYPAEVEAVLQAHPAVVEAAVIGIPDDEWGQAVVAVVHLSQAERVDAGQLRAFCRDRLAGYKVPREIRFHPALPRNAAGKLLRRSLRDWWQAGS